MAPGDVGGGTVQRVVGVVQPTYLPWLPFFERMARSDVFVYLDDVQFSKNSFHNRNSVKGPQGRILLTVPVLYSGNAGSMINEIGTDDRSSWGKKHWRTLQANYARAPFFKRYAEELESLFFLPAGKLIDAVMPLIHFLKRELGIVTPCHLSSAIGADGLRNAKLVSICKALNGTHFVVKPGTEDYHPPQEFQPDGIEFHKLSYNLFRYPQLHGEFIPGLSAIDFVLNCGPARFMDFLNESSQEAHS